MPQRTRVATGDSGSRGQNGDEARTWVWGPVMYEMTGPHVMPDIVRGPKTTFTARRRANLRRLDRSPAGFDSLGSVASDSWTRGPRGLPQPPIFRLQSSTRDFHNQSIGWADPLGRSEDRPDVLPSAAPPGRPEDRLARSTSSPAANSARKSRFPGPPDPSRSPSPAGVPRCDARFLLPPEPPA